jgi:hypothetical protein
MTDINNTSNYVARINTELTTSISGKQATINSTAGQLIIGNGDGFTTTSTGLTWNSVSNTLTATNLTTNTLNATNLAVSTYATITRLLTSVLTGGVDMFELQNNATNSLRFNQVYIGANDMKWLLIQKTNNVDNTLLNFRNGKIAIGSNSNPAYMVEVVGDINLTGEFRKNGTILKPAGAVLADTFPKSNLSLVAYGGGSTIRIATFDSQGVFAAPVLKPGVYANNTARDAAITAPSAGMIVFNTTGTKFQGYTGAAWVDLN